VEYGIAELAGASGLSVDTIRYYQNFGILPAPAREGRRAVYGQLHVERLGLIRSLTKKGFSLKAIRELLNQRGATQSDDILRGAIEEEQAEPRYSSKDFARALGIPGALLFSVEKAGLAEPQIDEHGRAAYSDSDLGVARGAIKLLEYGMPLTELLSLAVEHDRNVRATVDRSIDLFDDYIRKADGREDPEKAAEAFREILPVVVALVAHHFQRVLVNRALKRLRKSGEAGPLKAALKATGRSRFRLRWR